MNNSPESSSPEQVRLAMRQIAVLLSEYFDELIKNGFERDEALTLVMDFQATMLSRNRDPWDSLLR